MRFLVLGAGSQGSYFGGMLLRGGTDVSFLVRPGRAAELAERGLVIKLPDGEIRGPVKTLVAGGVDRPYEVFLLTCKSYDLDSAIEAIAPAIGGHSVILPVLNGINHIAVLEARFGQDCFLAAYPTLRARDHPRARWSGCPEPMERRSLAN
jgi:2-dehydropantoate 2-reductase